MDFDKAVASLGREISVVWQAPLPFFVCLCAIALLVWRVLAWRYAATIETLEHRLKLRDDTIEHYEDKIEKAPLIKQSTESEEVRVSSSFAETKPELVHAEAGRIFIPDTMVPKDLRALCANKTEIQARKLIAPYIGKWMIAEGFLKSLYELSDGISLALGVDPAVGIHHEEWLANITGIFQKDRDRLEMLRIKDKITCIGRIKNISEYNIDLEYCELVKAE